MVVFAWFNRVTLVRILALRQQLGVHKGKAKKSRLSRRFGVIYEVDRDVVMVFVEEITPHDY